MSDISASADGDVVMASDNNDSMRRGPAVRLASQAGLSTDGHTPKRARRAAPEPKIYNTRSRARMSLQTDQPHPTTTPTFPATPKVSKPPMERSPAASITTMTTPSPAPSSPIHMLHQELHFPLEPLPKPLFSECVSPHFHVVPFCRPSTAAVAAISTIAPSAPLGKRFDFSRLPPELRNRTIECLVDLWRHGSPAPMELLAPYATVSREFQAIIEPWIFSKLFLTPDRLGLFDCTVRESRRRCVRRIDLHVDLEHYFNDPCDQRETLSNKLANNQKFTDSFMTLFRSLADWPEHEVCKKGITLTFSVSSPSDLRNAQFELWQKRRWNAIDIGEKRFADSCLDFVGQDELRRLNQLPPVYAITSFQTSELNRRAVSPCAYADIISRLPRLETIQLNLFKEKRILSRKATFDHFAGLMRLWPPTVHTLEISAPTAASWRDMPHATYAEKDSGRLLGKSIQQFSAQLKHLRVRNVVKVRDLLRCVWPQDEEDFSATTSTGRWPSPGIKFPDLPWFERLETVHIDYGTICYNPVWRNTGVDSIEEDDSLFDWRQSLAIAAARMAWHMPKLWLMVIAQRPLMWAGKHRITFKVAPRREFSETETALVREAPMWTRDIQCKGKGPEEIAVVTWETTSAFRPRDHVMDAWATVAAQRSVEFRVGTLVDETWRTDGQIPLLAGTSF